MLKGFSGIIMIILIVAGIFAPVDIPYAFDSTAKAYPLQEWVLTKQADGALISTFHNYKTGLLKDYSSYQFDRGDVVNIKFNPDNIIQSSIDSGALVATIQSNSLMQRLIELENQRDIELANLQRNMVGAKPEIIQQTKEELSVAMQRLDNAQLKFNRARQMFNAGLVSKAAFEDAENNYLQAKNALAVARKKVTVVNTGKKQEDLAFIRSQINSLEKEIDFVKNTSGNYRIFSPITGKISFETGADGDKMRVADTSEHILVIPIRLRDRDFIDADTKIELDLLGLDTVIHADLFKIEEKVTILNNNVVVLAKASVPGKVEGLASGMPIKCTIKCDNVRPLEYLKRSTNMELK